MTNFFVPKAFNGYSSGKDNILIATPQEVFITDFDDKSIQDFKEHFTRCIDTGQEIIPIYIDSPGGDVTAVLGMIDIIKSSPVPVATIALGFCASAGTILLSAGTEGYRFASPTSQLMLHDLSAGVYGKEEDIKTYTKFIDKLQDIIYNVYDDNCSKERGTFKKIIKKARNTEWYIDVNKAKEINLINHIGIPKFKYEVNVSMTISNFLINKLESNDEKIFENQNTE